MLTFVLTLVHDFRPETSQTLPLPSCVPLNYYRPQTYSRLSGMLENHTIESNIIDVGQVVPEMSFSVFSMSEGGHIGFWALQVSKNL